MQEIGHHHETELAILVCLGANESVAIRHANRIRKAFLEPIELVQVGNRIDTTATNSVVVSGNATNHGNAWIFGVHERVHKETYHEKVTQKVNLHGLLVIVDAPLGIRQRRLVDTSVANEAIKGLGETKLVHLLAKGADRFKAVELAVHGRKVLQIKAVNLGDSFHLVEIADGANDVILPSTK